MARGFVTGVLWGCVAAGFGLVVLSQMAPPPKPANSTAPAEAPAVDQAADQSAAEKAAADKVAAEKAAADKLAADKAAEEKAAADKAAAEKAAADKLAADKAAADKAAADKAAADKAAADKAASDKAAADKAAADKAVADKAAADKAAALAAAPPLASTETPEAPVAAEVPALPDAPAAAEPAPSLTGLDQALTVPATEPAPAADVVAPEPAPEAAKDALLAPDQAKTQAQDQHLPQIAPVVDPEMAPVQPAAVAVPPADVMPATPAPVAPPKPAVMDAKPDTLPPAKPLQDKLPATVMDKTVPGVKTDSLPQVGVEPEVAAEPAAAADPASLPPIQRYARQFEGGQGKSLFVILLHDVGSAGMSRAELAKLPFPISFVIDPLATDAREAQATYRAAGQEVVTLANGIPQGAKAEDLETTFNTLSGILPEAVAVVDQDLGGFQDDRALASLVLPVLKGEGRGLITYDRGLNAADQIARRDEVPATTIFRRLDGEGESKVTIRRYLDRAAFKAAQEGAVVVIGDTRADTVAAILEWTVEGRAATVTLAPVTAVLGQ